MPLDQLTPQGGGGQPGKWVEVDSRSISSVSFDQDKFKLEVHFKDGDTWEYDDVPYAKFKALVYHSSSGSYLRKEIIPFCQGRKLNDGPPKS